MNRQQNAAAANPYDEMPYESRPFRQSHPERLATIAALFSLPAPRIETARVLEIGCAAGGNIVPIAALYPESHVVGVDYSQVQIDQGRRVVADLGLANVDLRCADLATVDESWGEFDYIICHGVYSWVSPQLQEKILAIAGGQLSPDGAAYVSYNAFPGWHMRGVVREMMRYHALRFDGPKLRVAEARRILDLVRRHAADVRSTAYEQLLQAEIDLLAKCDDHYIYHEHLEDHCEPLYFHEFIARARRHGLDYLGEPHPGAMAPMNFGSAAQQELRQLARDPIELEQFMDFLSNRQFRQTLLHRAGRTPVYELQPSIVEPLFIAGCGKPDATPIDFAKGVATMFRSPSGGTLATPLPLLKHAVVVLTEYWPRSLAFSELLAAACERFSAEPTDQTRTLLGRALLLAATTSDLIELSVMPSQFTINPSERPQALALARLQATESDLVVNARHEVAKLTPVERTFIQLLDGRHTVGQLAQDMRADEARVRASLGRFARLALLAS